MLWEQFRPRRISALLWILILAVPNNARALNSVLQALKAQGEMDRLWILLQPDSVLLHVRDSSATAKRVDEDGSVRSIALDVDFDNIGLMLLGRARHPNFQFLGDIISSGFDADKLDYIIRDATTCGLAITYDIDRYMAFVKLHNEETKEYKDELRKLYEKVVGIPDLAEASILTPTGIRLYRLRLPPEAITWLEQVVIDKVMLYSYVYHHAKVRGAEVLLERTLARALGLQAAEPPPTKEILRFLLMTTDSVFLTFWQNSSQPKEIRAASFRLYTRLLPRVIYNLGGRVGDPEEKGAVTTFMGYMDSPSRHKVTEVLERGIGEELVKSHPERAWASAEDALFETGGWVDAPKPLSFEDKEVLLPVTSPYEEAQPLDVLFPIDKWAKAYLNHVYRVRIYAYSESVNIVGDAAKAALKPTLGIYDDNFYNLKIRRRRAWA